MDAGTVKMQDGGSHFRVAIAGTGFGGLGMAIRLKQQGSDDFVLFERARDVGGVWRDNTYPGAACDVKSHLYSFSFAPNPSWTHAFSPQPEILEYLRGCADRFGVRPHIRFGHEVLEARWDDEAQRWRLRTSGGTFTADVFVSAVGGLSEPSIPALPGLERFRGTTMHSARWDHGYALDGKRVAVIGTGASAIQFIPAIQPKVGKLHVFQRTPAWVMPRNDDAIAGFLRAAYRALPMMQRARRGTIYALNEVFALGFMHPWILQRAQKLALRSLEKSVPDPVLREKLTPKYTMGCKRILLSDDYLPAMAQPNVDVITSSIQEVRETGVVTADGVEHPVDAILFGTGFHVTDMPVAKRIFGRDGRSLEQLWEGSPRAYLGTTVAGYPNLFLLQGPNTGLGHTSVVTMMESQIEHVLKALDYLETSAVAAVEPTVEAQESFVRAVDAKMKDTVWLQGGCSSWYLDGTGRNSTLWPGFSFTFKRKVERFDARDYVSVARHEAARG